MGILIFFTTIFLCCFAQESIDSKIIKDQLLQNQVLPFIRYSNINFINMFYRNVHDTSSYLNTSFLGSKYDRTNLDVNMLNVSLRNWEMRNSYFEQSELSNFFIHNSTFSNTSFKGNSYYNGKIQYSKHNKVRFDEAIFRNVVIFRSNFLESSFEGTRFQNVTFEGFYFKEVSFNRAIFDNVSFCGCEMDDVTFENTIFINVERDHKPWNGPKEQFKSKKTTDKITTIFKFDRIQAYNQFRGLFQKDYYDLQEKNYRRKIFEKNVQIIENHNRQKKSWQMGINQLTDLTDEEIQRSVLGSQFFQDKETPENVDLYIGPKKAQIDWKKQGIITSVKSQKNCNSCVAFSLISALQAYYIHQKKADLTLDLSEQQIIDCSPRYPFCTNGCEGAKTFTVLKYLAALGIATEEQYATPYIARHCCLHNRFKSECQENLNATTTCCKKIRGQYKVPKFYRATNCQKIAQYLHLGPVVVHIHSHESFFKFGKDIYNGKIELGGELQIFNGRCDESKGSSNHVLLLVGMTEDYWIAKNSYGINWGQNGYIKIQRGNTCGLCNLGYLIYDDDD